MSTEDLNTLLRERLKERIANDDRQFKECEKYPRCALLPSPEKLNTSINLPGSDVSGLFSIISHVSLSMK